jgi:hypothetical protein
MSRAHHQPMMTEQLAFNVIAAPLAAIDRRALSQAWYSSLHMAEQRASHPAGKAPAAQRFDRSLTIERPTRALPTQRVAKNAKTTSRPAEAHGSMAREADAERRVSRSPLARTIERTFLHPQAGQRRATFCVGSQKTRVYVAMQRLRGTLHLVAIAPPAVRAEVARALDEARYSLAERGIAISVALAEAGRER